jgi:hypothetical protein
MSIIFLKYFILFSILKAILSIGGGDMWSWKCRIMDEGKSPKKSIKGQTYPCYKMESKTFTFF